MDSNTVEPHDEIWYYERAGQQLGPVSEPNIMGMIKVGILGRDTAVWKAGFADWRKVEETDLRVHLDHSAPPPLSGQHVNNSVVWILAFAPIIGFVLEYAVAGLVYGDSPAAEAAATANQFWFVSLALNIALCYWDARKLRQAGHDTAKFKGWVWLVPVYLYQRAKAMKQNLAYFIVWIVCFGLNLAA